MNPNPGAAPQPDLSVSPVPSPCVNVCQMHIGSGWCAGCLRTLDEIARWGRMDELQKAAVWRQLEARRTAWQAVIGPHSLPGRGQG